MPQLPSSIQDSIVASSSTTCLSGLALVPLCDSTDTAEILILTKSRRIALAARCPSGCGKLVPQIYPMTACPLLRASICPLRRHSLFISIPSLSGPLTTGIPYHHSIARAQTPYWLASRDPRVGSPKIASGTRARAGIPQCTIDKSTAPSATGPRAAIVCLLASPRLPLPLVVPPRLAASTKHVRQPLRIVLRVPLFPAPPHPPPIYSLRSGRPTLRRGKSASKASSAASLPSPSLPSPSPTRRVAGSVPHPRRG
ncbi:hypothetical protein C2E23DRAFT_86735 [Lenzites betulinus]|nr:hypothetical protein C2E23DRAFT_86735 [Lenzites betulinus]